MSNNEFKIGDVVVLKSGGPKMTVSMILNEDEKEEYTGDCLCCWFTPDHMQFLNEVFYFAELTYVND